MKKILFIFSFLGIVSTAISQKSGAISISKDSVCVSTVTPTGNSPLADKATLWLRADKMGEIVYNCPSQLQNIGASSGVYSFDPDGDGLGIFKAYYDSNDGGWLMILNYVHQGGTNPVLNVRTTDLPLLGSSTLGTDESGTVYWGHAAPSLLNQFNIDKVRFYGRTSGHGRIINFSTNNSNTINYIKTGTGNMSGINLGFAALTGHSAFLPNSANNQYSNQGNNALTNFSYYRGGTYHWGIKGNSSRWEVDDYPNNFSRNTIHRVYIQTSNTSCSCAIQNPNPVNGNVVSSWGDYSNNGNGGGQTTVSKQPIYKNNTIDNINFNPSVFFDGTNDAIIVPYTTDVNQNNMTVYSVHQVDGSPGTWRTPFGSRLWGVGGYNIYASTANNYQFWTTSAGAGWDVLTNGPITANAELLGINLTAGVGSANKTLLRNGASVATTPAGIYNVNTSQNYSIGANGNGSSWFFNGRIAEQIVFPKILTASEKQKVESYLAIKYGITLTTNYYSPKGIVLFDISGGYSNGIIGIGKNKLQGLYQKKSHSESDATNGVTIEITNEISSGNYLVCGHNGGGLSRVTLAGETNVLARKYYAEQTGGIGTIKLELKLSEISANTSLPANQVKILIANNPAFTNAYVIEATSVVGGVAYFEGIPLQDKYFTFKAAL